MLLLSVGAATLLACDTFSSEPVGAVDASLDADAGQAPSSDGGADAATVNLLHNGDFEIGCGVWLAEGATVNEVEGRNGSRGCLVCGNKDVTVWGVSQAVDARPGVNYVAHAWFAAPASGATATAVEVQLEETSASKQINVSTTVAPGLTGTWVRVSPALAPTKPTTDSVTVALLARVPGGCFRTDDVSLEPVP